MKVLYTAPNRSHHYKYATALNAAGMLGHFVSGFSRFNKHSKIPDLGNKLVRADIIQNLFLGSMKSRLPIAIIDSLGYYAKVEQDLACKRLVEDVDVFLFYNGSGLITCKTAPTDVVTIVEAVNSHVEHQEQLLKEEHEMLKITWRNFHEKEKRRRIHEYHIADYILVPSDFVRESFVGRGFAPEKIIKVPFGFTLPSQRENVDNLPSGFTILFVGSISVRKGLRYLIQAFSLLRHPHKKLVIVGPRSQKTGLEDLDIPRNVHFTGVLKGSELSQVYSNADVFCLPTIEEGMALVIGEALSYGLPVVTTINSGACEVIDDGKEGFILPIRDVQMLHERLQFLADCPDDLQEMKDNANAKATTLKGWDKTGAELVQSLTKVYNEKRR
jgi:alpha-maltose-1-phosphate synthase